MISLAVISPARYCDSRNNASSFLGMAPLSVRQHGPAMTGFSDTTPSASRIQALQKARLRAIRQIVTSSQVDAARASDVSASAWNRMELHPGYGIDAVALAKFCSAYNIKAAEWVISGVFASLEDRYTKLLVKAHARLVDGELEDSEVPSIPAPSRSRASASRRTSKAPARVLPD